MKKDVVIGLGEIGLPIYKTISKHFPVEGIDINPILNKFKKQNEIKLVVDVDPISFN